MREAGEAAQIAENRNDFGAVAVEQGLLVAALDQFGDLRREKPLQPGDALRALLRQRQLAGHFIEPRCQPFKLVTSGDVDLVLEMPGANRRGALSQQPNRAGHAPRQEIAERRRESRAGKQQHRGSP